MTEAEIMAALRAGGHLCIGWRDPAAAEQQEHEPSVRARPRVKHYWLEPAGADVPLVYAEALIATGVVIPQSDGLFGGDAQTWAIAP